MIVLLFKNRDFMSAIRLKKEILESSEYRYAARLKVFITLLFLASESGEVTTTLSTLARRTQLTIKQIRSALSALTKSGKIIKHSTRYNTIINICNYESYLTL